MGSELVWLYYMFLKSHDFCFYVQPLKWAHETKPQPKKWLWTVCGMSFLIPQDGEAWWRHEEVYWGKKHSATPTFCFNHSEGNFKKAKHLPHKFSIF